MTAIVLIPGAGGDSWFWYRVVPLLEAHGFAVLAPDLPASDETATFDDYADVVVRAVEALREASTGSAPDPADASSSDATEASAVDDDLVVVAQSLAGFTAVRVCERLNVRLLIFVNAMIPALGETAGDWWANTGQGAAAAAYAVSEGRDPHAPFDVIETFFHDVPPDVVATAMERGEKPQSDGIFAAPWVATSWPATNVKVITGLRDRLFPLAFMQKLSRERLAIEPAVVDGGHLSALSAPDDLAQLITDFTLDRA
ncbi:MAG: hypothetical protein JWQ64_3657 [Subtercola sp.]|nr:hypothetical protein [Subtercola sp.]